MNVLKRGVYVAVIALLFGVSIYHSIRIIVQPEPAIEAYRGIVDDSTYNAIVRNEAIEAAKDSEPISLGEYIIAGFAAIGGALSLFKYLDARRNNRLDEKITSIEGTITDIKNIITDQTDKQTIFDRIDETVKDWIHNVESPETRMLILSIGERARKFADETMAQDLCADDLDCANVNIDQRCQESIKQVNELKFTDEFKQAFAVIQAENVIILRKELQAILDDRMHNHKYIRYGKAVTDFVRLFLRDIQKADNKYN